MTRTSPPVAARTELRSSSAMPGQVAAPPAAVPDWEDADPAMEQLDIEQMGRLEQANIDLVLEGLRIDPVLLDIRPVIRFWSHMCIAHGELISEVVRHGISARTIVVALQEAQAETDLSPGMDTIAAACPDLAARLRRAVTDRDMTKLWSPEDLEWRAREFRMGDLASEVEMWGGEDLHALSGMLQEMVDLCTATGATLTDYIDLDDLPPAALLAAGIGAAVPGMDSGNGGERRAS